MQYCTVSATPFSLASAAVDSLSVFSVLSVCLALSSGVAGWGDFGPAPYEVVKYDEVFCRPAMLTADVAGRIISSAAAAAKMGDDPITPPCIRRYHLHYWQRLLAAVNATRYTSPRDFCSGL